MTAGDILFWTFIYYTINNCHVDDMSVELKGIFSYGEPDCSGNYYEKVDVMWETEWW